jgi:hypothetical protein
MKPFYIIQTILGVIGTACVLPTLGPYPGISFLAGSGLVLFNLALFQWILKLLMDRKLILMDRKLIALGLLIIVIKYVILGIIVYQLLKVETLSVVWFSAGLTTLVASSLIYASIIPRLSER